MESFGEFKNSFSYGSRSDLSFKFLKGLSEEDAAEFLRLLLHEVGELYDNPSPNDLLDLVYEWQVKAYTPKPGTHRQYVYEDRPFEPLEKPLSEMTVGLVTSSGHFTVDDPPGSVPVGMNQAEAISAIDEFMRRAPELSEIPVDAPNAELRVRQPGYDTRSAEEDPEVSLPRRVLAELAGAGRFGSLAPLAYSFVGACSQGRLRNELGGWIERWRAAGIQALFLVPV